MTPFFILPRVLVVSGILKKILKEAARGLGVMAARSALKKDEAAKAAAILALRTAVSMGADLSLKPGIQANIQYLLQISREDWDPAIERPDADRIARYLDERRLEPNRIGVDGLPGSGKSTLARSLAKRLGMQWICLDHKMTEEPMDFSAPGAIYEHHRLFRTQNVENFDVLIHLDEPVSKVREQILSRGRGAALIEVFDFDRMREIGRKAFEMAGGEEWSVPDSNIRIKIRPPEGFRDVSRLEGELRRLGFSDTQDLSKEAKLFLATYGRARKGSLAYVRTEEFLKELLRVAARQTGSGRIG